MATFRALQKVKANKATWPHNIPVWVSMYYADILATPLTAMFNSSLREGALPNEWKMANVEPLPKINPPMLITKYSKKIPAKVFELIIMKRMDNIIEI